MSRFIASSVGAGGKPEIKAEAADQCMLVGRGVGFSSAARTRRCRRVLPLFAEIGRPNVPRFQHRPMARMQEPFLSLLILPQFWTMSLLTKDRCDPGAILPSVVVIHDSLGSVWRIQGESRCGKVAHLGRTIEMESQCPVPARIVLKHFAVRLLWRDRPNALGCDSVRDRRLRGGAM